MKYESGRRDFLVALLSIGLSRLAGRIEIPVYGAAPDPHPFAFRTLGASYLATDGAATRSGEFMEGLLELSHRSRTAAGRILVERRTADFESGRTVILDGWVVAESEALFCAGLLLPGAMPG